MKNLDVRWKNFHSFRDTDWLSLKPLTVLIGPNNSGKTSLIAPLLLLKQSFESDDLSLSLKTKGDFLNAGSYEDLISEHDSSRSLEFSFRWNKPKSLPRKELEPIGVYPPSTLSLTFSFNENTRSVYLKSFVIYDLYSRLLLRRDLLKSGNYSLRGLKYPPSTGTENRIARKAIRNAKPQRFLFQADNILHAILRQVERKTGKQKETKLREKKKISLTDEIMLYIGIVNYVEARISRILSNISYIGPLREQPRRHYELSDEKPRSVGTRGQFAPEMLFRSKDAALLSKVNEWMRWFGFGAKVECRELRDGAFTLEIRPRRRRYATNFADTGFGMSQIFPLIVQGLFSEKDSLLLYEQPEIHLNPKLQARLAELFVELVRLGRTIVIETHSEHFLLSLRRLIAGEQIAFDKVAVYYVEKEAQRSSVRQIHIGKNGHIEPEDWPKGFFEDSLREALELARIQSQG